VARAGRLIYDGFLVMWDGFWMVWLSNLFWLALMIPVITIPLAFAGLYACAHGIVYGESLEWRSFFRGIKKNFNASLRWTGANVFVLGIFVFYIWFFSYRINNLADAWRGLGSFFIGLALLWWGLNMFTFPFMLVQAKPSYLNALRNSAVLFLKWPGQAWGFTLFNFVVIGLSLWLRFPWLIFGASLPALMACLCVKDVIEQLDKTDLVKS
jgi:uncharacterized protein YjeT (DUF2065 family)